MINYLINFFYINSKMNCSICLSNLYFNKVCTDCNHTFHRSCLSTWLNNNNTCPLCRTPISMPINNSLIYRLTTMFSQLNRTPTQIQNNSPVTNDNNHIERIIDLQLERQIRLRRRGFSINPLTNTSAYDNINTNEDISVPSTVKLTYPFMDMPFNSLRGIGPEGYEIGKTYCVFPRDNGIKYMGKLIESYTIDVMNRGDPTRYYKFEITVNPPNSFVLFANECTSNLYEVLES